MKYTNIVINVSVAFVIASIIEMTLHEAGHFIAALLFHGSPTLFHNSVSYGNLQSDVSRIICAIAGPFVSLLFGILGHSVLKGNHYKGIAQIIWLYISIFGYIGFFGYISIAPFFSYGDTGYALRIVGCPMYVIIVLAIISVAIIFFIMKSLSSYIVAMMDVNTAQNYQRRNKFITAIVLYPLFIGIIITTILNLPVPTPLSLIAPITSPFVVLWPYYYYLTTQTKNTDEDQSINSQIKYKWILTLVILILVNRLLVLGIHI